MQIMLLQNWVQVQSPNKGFGGQSPLEAEAFRHLKNKKSRGAAVPLCVEGELDPHLSQCRLGRGVLPYQVVS